MHPTGVLVVLVISQVLSVQCGESMIYENLVQPLANDCKTSVGATDEDVQAVVSNGELKTEAQKCLQYCVYNKMKLLAGVEMAPLSEIVAAYKEIHADEADMLEKAESNVRACTEAAANKDLVAAGDHCGLAAAVHDCFRLQV